MLLSADYAQMELRLMAHLSGDAALCAMLRDPLQDPFTLWASQWMLIPASQASLAAWMRRDAFNREEKSVVNNMGYALSVIGEHEHSGAGLRELRALAGGWKCLQVQS